MLANCLLFASFLGNVFFLIEAKECNEIIGMSSGAIADKQIKASAFDGEYAASKARLNATSAWCVTSLNATRSFLEVDLGRVMRVTGIDIRRFTQGYVTNFTIEYKRTRDQRWISMIERLPFNTSFFPSFQGNGNNKKHEYRRFKGPRILRFLRFVALKGVGERWCAKLEFYGCEWKNKDGLKSYQAPQGNIRGYTNSKVTLNDATYDGKLQHYGRRFATLYGGLGQLTDGEVGGEAFWLDVGNGPSFEWLGWYDMVNKKPSLLFEFETPRKFKKMLLHGNNRPGNVKVFRNLIVAFSIDNLYYSSYVNFYPSQNLTSQKSKSLWIEVDLKGHVGKYLRLDFSYEGKWIVLSEIEFESEIYEGRIDNPTSWEVSTTLSVAGRTPSLRQVESNPPTTKPMLSLYGVIAMSVVGGALLLFTVVFGIWLTRMHRRDEEDEHPIRNVNRVINSLKRGSSLGRQKRKLESSMTSSTESVDDIEQLVSKKNSNEEANDLPWYKSLDRHKTNDMIKPNDPKSWSTWDNSPDENMKDPKKDISIES